MCVRADVHMKVGGQLAVVGSFLHYHVGLRD